uniref:Polygalacturonase n=2 Tax=Triticum urartu TaxID=4572 RepID=A0A8R7U3Z5_TRIUA
MILYECTQVQVHNVSITAPGDSPNTDGINMGSSNHVNISSCSMHTGDDCVSILSGTTNVNITNTTCGPGHGISVGSLGGVADGPTLVEKISVQLQLLQYHDRCEDQIVAGWQGTSNRIPFHQTQNDCRPVAYRYRPVLLPPRKLSTTGWWCGHNRRSIRRHPGDVLRTRGHQDHVQQECAMPRHLPQKRQPLLGQPHCPGTSYCSECPWKRHGNGEATNTVCW